jgi:hypothetical protein
MTVQAKIVTGLLCIGIVSCAGPGLHPTTNGLRTDVPFELVRNQIVVEARIQGQGPFSCLIDTGANPSALDIALAKQLQVPVAEKGGAAEGIGSGDVTVYPTEFNVTIGDGPEPRIPAVAIDLSSLSKALERPIHCILGQSWLRANVVQIDYPSERVRFSASSFEPPPPAFRCHESKMRFWLPDDLMPLVSIEVNGVELQVSLDTGSSGALKLFPDGAQEAGIDPSAGNRGGTVTGARGTSSVSKITISSVRFGPLYSENVSASIGERNQGEPKGSRMGNLGNGLLLGSLLTLDFQMKRILVCARPSSMGGVQQVVPGDVVASRRRP